MNANEEHDYPICKCCRDLMPKDYEWQECPKCMEEWKPETWMIYQNGSSGPNQKENM